MLVLCTYPYVILWKRILRGSKRAPRDVSVDFKSRPPPTVRNPEYAPEKRAGSDSGAGATWKTNQEPEPPKKYAGPQYCRNCKFRWNYWRTNARTNGLRGPIFKRVCYTVYKQVLLKISKRKKLKISARCADRMRFNWLSAQDPLKHGNL